MKNETINKNRSNIYVLRRRALKEVLSEIIEKEVTHAIRLCRDDEIGNTLRDIKILQNDIKWKQLKIDTLEREKKQLEEQIDKQKQELEKLKDIIVKEKLNNDK